MVAPFHPENADKGRCQIRLKKLDWICSFERRNLRKTVSDLSSDSKRFSLSYVITTSLEMKNI